MKVRTRYAPSPTGKFHIGGARTALFSYLYAKKNKGDFILRIEDTDLARNVENGIESQYSNMLWLNIVPDESLFNPGDFGPYKQTEKLLRYQDLANNLVESNSAYRCFCSPEDLEKNPGKYPKTCLHLSKEKISNNLIKNIPYAIRIVMPEDKIFVWDDLVRGSISIPSESMSDLVILKSNGIPTYNFGVIIDDFDMQISHVIRGEEHIANTPYQIHIKNLLGWDSFKILYGHVSIITNADGKKLSKRDESVKQFIEDYKNDGYPTAGIVNFLALLGWTPSDGKEIKSLSEIANDFNLENVSRSPAFFDIKKMQWICGEYIKKMSDKDFLEQAKKFLRTSFTDQVWIETFLLAYKPQISHFAEVNQHIPRFEQDLKSAYTDEENQILLTENSVKVASSLKLHLNEIKEWNVDSINAAVNAVKISVGIKGKDLFMPIRLITSHQSHGPELAKVIFLVGKQKAVSRTEDYLSGKK